MNELVLSVLGPEPFTEGVVPDTLDFEQALRFYASRDEFPIMPFYTANQHDKADAEASGKGGSNNFSNINSTLQAQLYAKAIRDYPSDHITPDMYRRLLEWLTWTQYVGADNRYPDNNEFFFISGLPVQSGSYIALNPIWGTLGSPNAQDWLEVDLGRPTRFDTAKLYFYSNKSLGWAATPTGSRRRTRCSTSTGTSGTTLPSRSGPRPRRCRTTTRSSSALSAQAG